MEAKMQCWKEHICEFEEADSTEKQYHNNLPKYVYNVVVNWCQY